MANTVQLTKNGQPVFPVTDESLVMGLNYRQYDSQNPNGMGYLVLKKNKTFAEQVTEANTVYEIRYDFDLANATVTIPSGSILKFNGGKISNGTLNGSNTKVDAGLDFVFSANLSGTWDVETYFPEWFGAVGDGTTDDTTAFSKLDGKHVRLSNKTYLISNVTFGINTSIIGAGRGISILKQKDGSTGDFITLLNWSYGILKDVTIQGGTNIVEKNFQQALVKMKTTSGGLSNRSLIDNVVITDSKYNGLSILGKDEVDDGVTCWWNWIFTISNLWIGRCERACIYNKSSDNQFSNINASGGQLAGIIERGSSNNWMNLKVDGESCYRCDRTNLQALLENTMQGAAVIIEANLVNFVNLDIQSSSVCGLKIVSGQRIHISGNINNCALYIDRNQKALSPALYVLTKLEDSELSLFFLPNRTQYKQFSNAQGASIARNILNFLFQPEYYGNRSYEYELMLCKRSNIVNDATLFPSSNEIKHVKNLYPENMETSSLFYKSGGTIDNNGEIFGGTTPSYHLPDANGTNGFEILPSDVSRGQRPGDVLMAMMVIKPASIPQSPLLPYFNIIPVGSSENLYISRADNIQSDNIQVGQKYLVSVIFKVPSTGNFNVRCYRTANRGEYYISNIKLYNLTKDIGFNLPTLLNYQAAYHIMDVLFASNNLAELTEEFGNIPVEMSLLGNAVTSPSVESRIEALEQAQSTPAESTP